MEGSNVEDLRYCGYPVGNFLDSTSLPKGEDEVNPYLLTNEQLKFYEENGYVTGVKILTPDQVDRLLAELVRLQDSRHPRHALFHEFHSNESPDPGKVLMHALGAWRIEEGFHDVIFHPAALYPAHQLLGNKPVRFWHDQLFCKPPNIGSCVAWHQDYSYWTRTKPMAHLTIHIALDDQTLENGCLHYVPGSHKWPLLPITSRHFNDMESIKTFLSPDQIQQFKPVPLLLKKGEASIHHPLLVHGSYENRSEGPRRATVINVFEDGVVSNADEPLLLGTPLFGPNEKVQGDFFPLLFDNRPVTRDRH